MQKKRSENNSTLKWRVFNFCCWDTSRSESVETIPFEAKTITTERFLMESVNQNHFNPLAKAWYAYSKLNASTSKLEKRLFSNDMARIWDCQTEVGKMSDITVCKEQQDKELPTGFRFVLKTSLVI